MEPIDSPNNNQVAQVIDAKAVSTFDILQNLPPLKSTISIEYAGIDFWQDKVWILADRLTNKFYYLGKVEFEIISRWQMGNANDIVSSVNNETIHQIDTNSVDVVFKFLLSSNLLLVSNSIIKSLEKARKNKYFMALANVSKIFSYKIPLVNPNKFLDNTKDIANFLFSKYFTYFILCLLVLNTYLLASNWGSFTDSLPSFNNWGTLVLVLLTMVFTKLIHEFGHAYAAKLYHCTVPEMGVNFIFFYPLAYTDVASTITLNPKERLVVSTAGLRFEIYLAIVAGYFWFLLPDGTILKHLLFFIAAVSWLLSLFVNIMPFMKFDGYYIFSDYLRIRNLAPRCFAVMKYYFRKYAIGLDTALPELHDYHKYKFLLTFGIMMSLYRIILMISILYFLYYIEIIGDVLFVLGVTMMFIGPVAKEAYNLWLLREKITINVHTISTSIIIAVFFITFFIPYTRYIYLPAVFYAKTQRIYSPFISVVDQVKVRVDQNVIANQDLIQLKSLELMTREQIQKHNLQAVKQIATEVQLSEKDHKITELKLADVEYQKTIGQNIAAKNEQLQVKTPINGTITAMYDGIYPGMWLGEKDWLLDVVDFTELDVEAFARSQDLRSMDVNQKTDIMFIPDSLDFYPCKVAFISLATDPIGKIKSEANVVLTLAKSKLLSSNLLAFASIYNGSINFNMDEESNLVSVDSYFSLDLRASPDCKKNGDRIVKGVVKIKGYSKSLAASAVQKIGLFVSK